MVKILDPEKIREMLGVFLDEHADTPESAWAAKMGLSRVTLSEFLKGTLKCQRKTLKRIKDYIEEYEDKEPRCKRCTHNHGE